MRLNAQEEATLKAELDAMTRQFPAILQEIQRDREEGERWAERSRARRQQTRSVFADIENLLKKL
jgi:hypothetical protein